MLETKHLTDQCNDALKPKSESKFGSKSDSCDDPCKPNPCKAKKCIANHGTKVGDPLCCGQKGVLQKYATNYVCSKSAPTCSNFVCGESYGTCI
jgi:hypothetical protein